MSELNSRIDSLSPTKRALLEQRLRAQQPEQQAISPRPAGSESVLSSAQQRLCFLDQMTPGSAVYNRPTHFRLSGSLDAQALHESLNAMVARHNVLRMTFRQVAGEFVGAIAPKLLIDLPTIDLSSKHDADQTAQVEQLATIAGKQSFDLATGPLIRAQLVKLGEQSHLLLVNIHHIVFDGWSVSIFQRELAELYGAIALNQPLTLPPLPIQYNDFAHWQQHTQTDLQPQLDYWQQQLSGTLPPLSLPVARLSTEAANADINAGASHTERLPKALSEQIKALCKQKDVTLFMLLLAAFQTLLYRYSGQRDVIVGTPIAGRDRVELEPLLGLFINSLTLRTSFENNPTFSELLRQVRATTLEAYANQSLPFEKLVEVLQPERLHGQTPIFQTLFQLRNLPDEASAAAGLTIESVKLSQPTAQFDLSLDVVEKSGELCCQFQYRKMRFEADTIRQIGRHFQALLTAVVADVHQPVSQISLLSETDYRQLESWQTTDDSYPTERCVHQLFEHQVLRSPDAIAVSDQNHSLTYRTLNERANQLAAYLKTLKVGTDICVGLCIERSVEMIVGLLGIWKAGGAYLPIDPQYPKARISLILTESKTPILLTSSHLLPDLEGDNYKTVALDTPIPSVEVCTGKQEENSNSSAYVIYTSGSTGKPKGVIVEHRSVVNLAYGLRSKLQQSSASADSLKVSVNGSLAFDTSVKQIVQLLYGHSLQIIPDRLRFDGKALLAYLQQQSVQRLDCTPSQLRLLLSAGLLKKETSLQQVLVGGEPIDGALWRTLAKSTIRFYNVYGPTECTVDATIALIEGEVPHIGRPIANVSVHVVTPEGNALQPVRALGELWVTGAGVARGYINQEALTKEKFVSFETLLGMQTAVAHRAYRTGDLGRYRADGTIEYVGRLDQQVKIRGFRVELGEIEAVVNAQPQVCDCAVVLRTDADSTRLVAYVVCDTDTGDKDTNDEERLTPEALRRFIAGQLPEYMVPAAYVFLDALPLTINGKLNKQALPAPDPAQRSVAGSFVPPRNTVEREILAIWQELLQLDRIGVHDNLFQLGGHSLLITRIAARLYNRFSVDISLRTLFEQPTITQTAEKIIELTKIDHAGLDNTKGSSIENLPVVKHIEPIHPRPQLIPASFTQQRWWFFQQLEPNMSLYNRPRLFCLRPDIPVTVVKQALNTVITRHEVLRTSLTMVNQTLVQVVNENWSLDVPIVDVSAVSADRKAQTLRAEIDAAVKEKIDLADKLMLTARLLDFGGNDRSLLLIMHHVISDHWTLDLLLNELTTVCNGLVQQHQESLNLLPELPIQYADFAIYQQQQAQQSTFQSHLDYWRNKLSGDLPVLDLPTDRPRLKTRSYRGATIPLKLSSALTQQLNALSQQENVTLFMTMLTAFQVLLYRYTHQTDLVLGLPVAGRQWEESEQLLGCFLNTLALRTDVSSTPTFTALLQRVRVNCLEAFEHQYCPFEKVIEQLSVSRDDKQSPVFNVFFDFINTPHSVDTHSLGVEETLPLTPIRVERGTAMFDLTIYLEEKADGLEVLFEYACDLFDAETIHRFAGYFETLLNSVVTQPAQQIDQLAMLTRAERHQLIVEWNQTQTAYPTQPIHRLFEAQVQKTPEAIALTQTSNASTHTLTYQQLNQQANHLAHYLKSLGVSPGALVGICCDRSSKMVISMLAILKAGGAYVPLDPSYPAERLSFMLQDTQLPVLLTTSALLNSELSLELNHVFDQCDAKIVNLDLVLDAESLRTANVLENLTTPSTTPSATADSLAYVIYTSGSTGTPKGVMVPHRAVNRLVCESNYVQVQAGDRIAQASNTSFDAATFEIWGALLNGAQLVMVNKETLLSPRAFAEFLQVQQISILFITTALFNQLASLSPATFSSLRCLLFGGEAVDASWVKSVVTHGKPQQLLHVYGPTENTTFSTYYPVSVVSEGATTVPIGRPVANTQAYVLDAQQQPVPVGVAGELFLGGAGLAQGYLNRPEINSKQFIDHPFVDYSFNHSPDAKLYRTGDLVRYLPDGNLVFVGRIDRQVKIRGFRIELGEIEAVLAQHSAVQDVVVTAWSEPLPNADREQKSARIVDKRLVSYVVVKHKTIDESPAKSPAELQLDARELGRFVRERLPSYMVPAAFVFLPQLPLTPNGKVNRKALPVPDFTQQMAGQPFVAPQTPIEKQVSQIWCELLSLEQVGIDDDFFELGGHSLLATQVISRVRSLFLVEVPLRSLFETATVRALAQQVETRLWMRSDELTGVSNKINSAWEDEVEEREEIEF